MAQAQVGVSVTVQGQTRLAHALGLELFDALQIGIRCQPKTDGENQLVLSEKLQDLGSFAV